MQVSKNRFFSSNKLKNVEFSREWTMVWVVTEKSLLKKRK